MLLLLNKNHTMQSCGSGVARFETSADNNVVYNSASENL